MKRWMILGLLVSAVAFGAKPKVKPAPPVLSPIRPFIGASQVWGVEGEAVLGPEAASAIDRFVSQPPELPAGCKLGDLKISARAVEVGVTCGDGPHTLQASLQSAGSAAAQFAIQLWPGAAETFGPVREELTKRFNEHGAEIPLSASGYAAGSDAAVPPPLVPWHTAATALAAHDLSAAATAVDLGLTAGPSALSPGQRIKAATLTTAVLRARGEDWRSKVKPWLVLGKDAEQADQLAAAVLAGKAPGVVADTLACRAAPAPCRFLPVVGALLAVGRGPEAATLMAKVVEPEDTSVDLLRLAVGVADVAGAVPQQLELAKRLTHVRPDDLLGWLNVFAAQRQAADYVGALTTLAGVPEKVAQMPEILLPVSALVDALWDRSTPESLNDAQRAAVLAAAKAHATATQELLAILTDGWAGRTDGLDARLAALPQQPHIVAWRACVAMAENRFGDARKFLAGQADDLTQEPVVLAAMVELALQDPETTDERAKTLQVAWREASTREGRLGRPEREARWQAATELRAWGLQPPLRWPLTGRLGP